MAATFIDRPTNVEDNFQDDEWWTTGVFGCNVPAGLSPVRHYAPVQRANGLDHCRDSEFYKGCKAIRGYPPHQHTFAYRITASAKFRWELPVIRTASFAKHPLQNHLWDKAWHCFKARNGVCARGQREPQTAGSGLDSAPRTLSRSLDWLSRIAHMLCASKDPKR